MTKTFTTLAVLATLGASLAATSAMAAGYRDRNDSFSHPSRTPNAVEQAYKAGKADGKREATVKNRFERENHFRPWWARHGFNRWGFGYGHDHRAR